MPNYKPSLANIKQPQTLAGKLTALSKNVDSPTFADEDTVLHAIDQTVPALTNVKGKPRAELSQMLLSLDPVKRPQEVSKLLNKIQTVNPTLVSIKNTEDATLVHIADNLGALAPQQQKLLLNELNKANPSLLQQVPSKNQTLLSAL